jgi:APA family basic amino acid/polyamine antiporter
MSASKGTLGLGSGIGLCVASMVGAGIFLSSGYMAQEMSAGPILLAWLTGGVLALLGVKTYAELSRQIPRSGGEYRYLSEFLHPAVGYVAGWVTLIIGFAQPTAINALAATTFLNTLIDVPSPPLVAGTAIILIASGHALGGTQSRWLQNLLVIAKVLLLVGFVALGVIAGSHEWPDWQPPSGSTTLGAFVGSLFYISYAFSGWNTTAYAAESFRDPKDVGRAMLIACLGVLVFYMLVNWIFVANLTPNQAAVVVESNQAVLGHLVTTQLIGELGGRLMSVLAVLSFLSAMSAMLMIGPHIASSMANDGALPGFFKQQGDEPPRNAMVFQVLLALVVLSLHDLKEALQSVGATLMLFSALSALALVIGYWRRTLPAAPRRGSIIAAMAFAMFSTWLLYMGFRDQAQQLPWLGAIIGLALVAYWLTASRIRRYHEDR